ncbi:MAG: ABC transporter ATP-binding protein [Acidobacteria bacterium]|nr:ABC transporter ATP-binding protein [Acidobacteriota bacterium]
MLDPQFRRALAYVAPYWRRLVPVVVLSLASTVTSLLVPLLSRALIDDALLAGDSAMLVRIVAAFVGLTALGFLLNVASGLRYTRVSAEILFDMRLDLYRHLQRLSPRFYARTRMGDIVSRLNNDIGEIQRVAAEAALAWIGNILFLAGAVGMMIWLDARLFLAGLAVLPLSIWALVLYRRRLERRVAVFRERSADIGSFLIETLSAMRLVVTSNAQDREAGRFRDRNQSFIGALMAMQRVTYLAGGLPGVILSAGMGVVFLYGGFRFLDGTLSLGTLGAFMTYQMRLMGPVQALMGLYASLATAKVSLRRVHEIADAPVEVQEEAVPAETGAEQPEAEQPEAATTRPATTAEVGGAVAFDGVSFSFDRGAPTLERVSFVIAPGETVAIVGRSGAGKSTVADLLLRLLDPDRGAVRLDGRDLRTLPLASVRGRIALVDQAPFIFHTSLRDNVRYARPEANDDEVAAAVRAAGLDELVRGMPEGLDTVVGERGAALSAGERQRVAIARAFLADPRVLVLDEATAALDPVTEQRVVGGYEALMRARTTVVITHRLELARRADRVVALDGARVAEVGPPDELLARGGFFARLFRSDADRRATAHDTARRDAATRGAAEAASVR